MRLTVQSTLSFGLLARVQARGGAHGGGGGRIAVLLAAGVAPSPAVSQLDASRTLNGGGPGTVFLRDDTTGAGGLLVVDDGALSTTALFPATNLPSEGGTLSLDSLRVLRGAHLVTPDVTTITGATQVDPGSTFIAPNLSLP